MIRVAGFASLGYAGVGVRLYRAGAAAPGLGTALSLASRLAAAGLTAVAAVLTAALGGISAAALAMTWPMLRVPSFLFFGAGLACGVLLCCCRTSSKNYTSHLYAGFTAIF